VERPAEVTELPHPVPDTVSQFYWDGARRCELMCLRCRRCARFHHPPEVACPYCGGTSLQEEALGGKGVVFASAVVRQPFDQAFVAEVPYVVALIELDEQPGLRILANVRGAESEAPSPGTPVRVEFEDRGGCSLPQFVVDAP